MKEADNPAGQDIIAALAETEEGIMQAKQSLNYISEDEKQLYRQWSMDDYRRDRVSERNAAHRKGVAEGERNKALETARNFLGLGLSAEQVAAGTGLALEEVRAMQA